MTTNNHPAHGPVSLKRLHQISEILSKAAAQSDGGNLGYAMADAVKVIDVAIAAFGSEPAGYADPQAFVNFKSMGGKNAACTKEWMWRDPYNGLIPLYTAPPAPVVHDDLLNMAASAIEDLLEHTDPSTSYYSGVWADVPGKLRSAMLQAGNYPVTPDGWIPVSERMPPEGVPLLICSGNGVVQLTVYGFDGENWIDWYEQYDQVKAEPDDLWQPLPAAPQQK